MKTEILTFRKIIDRHELAMMKQGKKDYLVHMVRSECSRAMADKLAEHLGPPKEIVRDDLHAVEWRWSLAVGDIESQKEIRAAIDREVANRLSLIATDIYRQAKAEIHHFGSAVGSTTIHKDTAISFVSKAIAAAIQETQTQRQP